MARTEQVTFSHPFHHEILFRDGAAQNECSRMLGSAYLASSRTEGVDKALVAAFLHLAQSAQLQIPAFKSEEVPSQLTLCLSFLSLGRALWIEGINR